MLTRYIIRHINLNRHGKNNSLLALTILLFNAVNTSAQTMPAFSSYNPGVNTTITSPVSNTGISDIGSNSIKLQSISSTNSTNTIKINPNTPILPGAGTSTPLLPGSAINSIKNNGSAITVPGNNATNFTPGNQ